MQVPFVKISVEDRAQDLIDRFSVEAAVQDPCITLPVQGVYRRSPQKIFVEGSLEVKGARNGRKVAKHPVFSMICGSGGSKSRWEGLQFRASDLQVCWDDFAWQAQHFVSPGITFFRGRRSSLDRWTGKIAKRIGTRPSALHISALNFQFLKEVSHNCFVFNVVKFEKWRSLAELFRFWRC